MAGHLKLSTGQAETLEALLVGQPYWYRKVEFPDGRTTWIPKGARGGARYRVADDLRDHGLLSRDIHDKRIKDEFGRASWENQLTAKGLRALDAYLRSGRRYDPTDSRLKLIADQLPIREKLEKAIADRQDALKKADRELADRRNAERLDKHMTELRRRLTAHGLADFVANKTDDDLLAFVRDIEGAEFA